MLLNEPILESPSQTQFMINLEDLESKILKGFNLQIKTGEIYTILGRSDCGKSELLRYINLMQEPKYGKMVVDKQNLHSLLTKDLSTFRRKIALLTKNPQLINLKKVFDNVALPLEFQPDLTNKDLPKIIDPILNFVGIADLAFNFPSQLNLLQKHLVCLARALVSQPKVLLCDDLTYNLDAKATHQIVNLLNSINKQFATTILIVSNEIEIIKSLSHRVGVMDKGKLVEEAAAFEIFARPKTEFAKELVKAATKQEMPWVYRKKIRFQAAQNQHPIVRISFTTTLAAEQLLGQLIAHYQFKISIIQAYQEYIQNHPINVILAELEGQAEKFTDAFAEAVTFLQQHELHVEVLGYVANVA